MKYGFLARGCIVGFSLAALTGTVSCTHGESAQNSSQISSQISAEDEAFLNREPATNPMPSVAPGEVWGPEQVQLAKDILRASIVTAKSNRIAGFVHRDAHPKAHGCVKAEWQTDNSQLESKYRVGIFANNGTKYQSWVRLSNGSPGGTEASDDDKDVRGMAIKLLNVPGADSGNQDFVLMTSPRFFSKDAADYADLHRAISGQWWDIGGYLATHPTNLSILLGARVRISNPLATTYFSPVPLKLADTSMRLKVLPCSAQGGTTEKPTFDRGDRSHRNYLREALVSTLKKHAACFDFFIEPNHDLNANPIEDPRLVWDEKKSPFVKVARLMIPQIHEEADVTSEKQLAFCENVSFTPWNTQDEIRPLGQINRIRKVVYIGISRYRHLMNKTAELQPVDLSPCENPATSALCNR
jgi:hypothetical protein